jgi:hypothetical protein
MPPQHAGSGEAHHLPDALTHGGVVAVDQTVGARGLLLLERAAIEAEVGEVLKLLAFVAQLPPASVPRAAGEADHGGHGRPLPRHPPRLSAAH